MPKKKPKGASEAKKKRMEAKRLAKMARKAEKKAAQGGAVRPELLQGLVGISQPLQKKQYPTGDTMPIPPAPLLELIHDFLKDYKYIKAAHGVRTDNQKRPGHNMAVWKHSAKGYPNLINIFRTWLHQNPLAIPENKSEDVDMAKSDSSSTSSSSDDEAMSVDAASKPSTVVTAPNAPLASLKRKASASSSDSHDQSSSSNSENDVSSNSESDSEVESAPVAKKAKVKHTTSTSPTTSGSTSSSSSSSSEDESDSGVPTSAPTAPTESTSGSSSESSLEDSEKDEPAGEITKSTAATRNGSDSSTTIAGVDGDLHKPAGRASSSSSDSSSSDSSSDEEDTALPKQKSEKKKQELIVYNEPLSKKKRKRDPGAVGEQKIVPATANTFKKLKKAHISFSRIPDDIKVDERFASNKYIPYDYAEKAHNDLIVTKGKGFTKAKNKGKRGSYKGGMIDTNAGRGIKFED